MTRSSAAYRYETRRGAEPGDWLTRARAFGDFLVGAQNEDGSFFRAYTLEGDAITEPVTGSGRPRCNKNRRRPRWSPSCSICMG